MTKKLDGTLKPTPGFQFDVQIFNLNISQLNLPAITNEQVIDEYETAFSHQIAQMSTNGEGFTLHSLIEFFQMNLLFTRYGFYPGFT